MLLRMLLLLFSILGIFATFLPWLYYPRAGASIRGYESDGVITGFIFLLILIFGIYNFRRSQINNIGSIVVGTIGLLLGYLAYKNILGIELEKLNFSTDDPIIAYGTAGFTQGWGIYTMGIAGIGVFISILLIQLLQTNLIKQTSNESPKISKSNLLVLGFVILAMIAVPTGFYYLKNAPHSISDTQIQANINSSVSMMGNALIKEQYDEFINFNHPISVQSNGGRMKTVSLVRASLDRIKESGKRIKSIELDKVYDIQKQDNNIQAIIGQLVILDSSGIDKTELQKVIAISDDNGIKWQFININNKPKSQLIQDFPFINSKLKF